MAARVKVFAISVACALITVTSADAQQQMTPPPLEVTASPVQPLAVNTTAVRTLASALSFEKVHDRTEDRFVAPVNGGRMILEKNSLALVLGPLSPAPRKRLLRIRFGDANPAAAISGEQELPGKIYHAAVNTLGPLSGNATFRRVRYSQLYSGIDTVFYGNDHGVEFDFHVAPHADPHRIRLSLAGADHIQLDPSGDLSLRIARQEVQLKRPVIYQEQDGVRTNITGRYRLSHNNSEVQLEIGSYDHNLPLIIDPAITFATYFGGTGDESVSAIKVDSAGAVYLLGTTSAPSALPPHQTFPIPVAGYSAQCFLTKLAADGGTTLYTVVFDGGFCGAMDIGVNGTVHLALGYHLRTLTEATMSLDLLQGAYDLSGTDGSVSQLRADVSGNVYIVVPYTPDGAVAPFIFELRKLDSTGQVVFRNQILSELDLASFGDQVGALDIDQTGRAFVVGEVASDGNIFPTPDAFQPAKPSTGRDGFLLKINTGAPAQQNPIEYATFLGGTQDDYLNSVLFDASTNTVLISGATQSPDFPTTPGTLAPSYTVFTTNFEAFLVRLDLSQHPAQQMLFGTYLGARSDASALGVLPGGRPVIAGYASDHAASTTDPAFPLVNSFYPSTGSGDGARNFLSVFSPDGKSLLFSTFLTPVPNSENSTPTVASNGSQVLYVGTGTNVQGLVVGKVLQSSNAGGYDLLLRAIDFSDVLGIRTASSITLTSSPNPAVAGQTVTLTATVSASTGTIPDGELVTFSDGTNPIGSGALISGSATLSTSALRAGDHSLTAGYSGDARFLGSVSSVVIETISATSSSTTMTSSQNPSVAGRPVTFTATVAGVSPSGIVTFTSDGNAISNPVALSSGSASLTTSGLPAGTHSIVATYGGDSTNRGSVSQPLTQVVNTAVTSNVVLSSSVNPSIAGQSVMFTATINGQSPTGSVDFLDATTIFETVSVENGTASTSRIFPSAGLYSITARYSGDFTNDGSVSQTVTQVVNTPGATSVALTSSPNPSIVGQSIKVAAKVTGLNPTGTITFLDGVAAIGTGFLTNGAAILTTNSLTAGTHSISASYSGDFQNAVSTSSALVQTVTPPYSIVDLGTLGGTDSQGFAINDNGQVTGSSFYPGGDVLDQHAFVTSPPYTNLVDVDTLGSTLSGGRGINNVGQITGSYTAGIGGAFLASAPYGFMLDLGTLGGRESQAFAVNDQGVIAGTSNLPNSTWSHAFYWNGTMHDLGTLTGFGNSNAFGINNSGQVTGSSLAPNNEVHAFIYTPSTGTTADIGTLGFGLSVGQAINDSGQVAGYAWAAPSVEHAFLWDGTMHDLGTLAGGRSLAFGINASGHVVGSSQTTGDFAHAFLYTQTAGMVDLNSLIAADSGWKLLVANAINDAGQITGHGINPIGQSHAFVLTPPPAAMGALIGGTAVAKPSSGTADAVFTVTFYNSSAQPVAVNFATIDGTAVAGADYLGTSGTLTFAPGITTQPVAVRILGGAPNPSNRSFTFGITNATTSSVLATATGTIVVPAIPPPIAYTISATPASIALTASVTKTATVNLQSDNGIGDTAELSAAFIGTVPAGVTYSLSNSRVNIPANRSASASATLTITTSDSPSVGTFELRVTSTSATGVARSIDMTIVVADTLPATGCGCTKAGAFVDPRVQGLASPRTEPGVAFPTVGDGPGGFGKITTSRNLLTLIRNSDEKIILNGANNISAFGFSPNGKFFVLITQPSPGAFALDVYDVVNARLIAPGSPLATNPLSWGFSPDDDNRYFVVTTSTNLASFVLVDIYDTQTGTRVMEENVVGYSAVGNPEWTTEEDVDANDSDSSSNDQVGGWGFSPDGTKFALSYKTAPNAYFFGMWNLTQVNFAVQGITRHDVASFWQFSPCGELLTFVSQAGANPATSDSVDFVFASNFHTYKELNLSATDAPAAEVVTEPDGSRQIALTGMSQASIPNPQCSLASTIHSPANIVLTDAVGRRTGFDASTGGVLNEIPGGHYTGIASEPQSITVPYAVEGYVLDAWGLDSLASPQPYTLTFSVADASGDVINQTSISGTTSRGLDQRYAFTVGNGPIKPSPVTPPDTAPPQIVCAAPDGRWHAADVSLGCAATDSQSGLANVSDGIFALSTHVAMGTEASNTSTDSRQVCDRTGNCSVAGPIPGNMVDKKAPSIAITAPLGTYVVGQAVSASYSCTDGGSGVASCNGTVTNGSAIHTGTAGSKAFTVNAADVVGNNSSLVSSYTVTYKVCLLYDPTVGKKSGSAYPIKLQLCDSNGKNLSSSSIVVHAVSVTQASTDVPTTLDDTGSANPDFDFRFDSSLNGYIFNLGTKGYASGTYNLNFTAGLDTVVHRAPLAIK